MSYKNFLFILLLLLLDNAVHAQDTLSRKVYEPNKYWIAKIPLLNLIDLNSPNLSIALERRLNGKNSVQFLAGISTDISTTALKPHDYSVVNGFRLAAEYRHYYHVRRKASFFLAADVFYTGYRHYTDDSFISQSTNIHYSDSYYLKKKMEGANAKWGVQYHSGHFMFEAFAGLGFKYKTVTEVGRTAPGDEHVPPPRLTDMNLGAVGNMLGAYTTISTPANFVVGYIFR